jgi:DNA-binding GntR family transcriptional regulator
MSLVKRTRRASEVQSPVAFSWIYAHFHLRSRAMISNADSEEGLNTAVYNELRTRLVMGRMSPGHELSTRSIAAELGVSQTPVRDALSRLAAEGAVAIRSKRRVRVPPMTAERFEDLQRCRLLLEPEAAALAIPHLNETHVKLLHEIGKQQDEAVARGDADAYMRANYAFHFTLYRAHNKQTLIQLIETLWLQFGPFMRLLYGRVAHSPLHDNHEAAIAAIKAGDAEAMRAAIRADICDGMGLIARTGFSSETGPRA